MQRVLILLAKTPFWLLVPLLVILAEFAGQVLLTNSTIAEAIVDIQAPGTLHAKLNYLRAYRGYKVVLLGDSLVYGGILADYGDNDWRDHNLAPLLKARLQNSGRGADVLVMNLGINGALPADLEKLVRLVVPCQVDLVIFDTHLRPFSLDFAAEDSQYARPWLKDLVAGSDRAAVSCNPAAALGVLGSALSDFLAGQSSMWQLREFTQQALAESTLARTTQSLRRRLNGSTTASVQGDPDLILLELKNRLDKTSLEPTNPQRAAHDRMLAYLRACRQSTIAFYAKENPALVHSIMSRATHRSLQQQLARTFLETADSAITYLSPCPDLKDRHFLDYSHLNKEGYQVLADYLMTRVPTHVTR